jgi:hypothetical protein
MKGSSSPWTSPAIVPLLGLLLLADLVGLPLHEGFRLSHGLRVAFDVDMVPGLADNRQIVRVDDRMYDPLDFLDLFLDVSC